ncbi:TIGR02646 family protein [Proteiniphilum saccharofermentans]|uniref:TIGR02646 family protein n=1 Tax=Proteiniphilum saccharofermentans TaxID=1642647 RepID=A0A1R3SZ66_9BACT|nr:TIGR02646 family protein [Proteiniphilum saccharofermentans]
MRHIEKKNSPEVFQDFILKNSPAVWDDIHKSQLRIYEDICEVLLKEQNNLCGYTELPLNNKHIDHYHKRVLYPEKCFCWDNLIMATLDDDFGARYKDKQINRKEIYNEIFNPVVDNRKHSVNPVLF